MKSISNALQDHLGQELTTLAELVRITRADGQVIALTTHDRDIVLDDVTYRADAAFHAGKIAQAATLKTGNYEISGMLDSAMISEADIKNGLYDHARIDVLVCNWADVSQGAVWIRRGWLGEVAISGGQYIANLRGFHDLLSRKIGETYTPECRHDLGDTRCGVDLASCTITGSVTGLIDARKFTDVARTQEQGAFNGAQLTWLTGANAGKSCEVCDWQAQTKVMTLWLPVPAPLAVGDTYKVASGCDKRFSTCRARFNNGVNYGGFPYLPGLGKILQYPD